MRRFLSLPAKWLRCNNHVIKDQICHVLLDLLLNRQLYFKYHAYAYTGYYIPITLD
jgi:hypothetical protein